MTKNIKEIGKELMGKSLNSFHRKTGLTQLEKNNEMQDGILDGILSQVDDAYIEKTEQSNVIHLEGSGDGVVVLDSIEGNTMVNLFDKNGKSMSFLDYNNADMSYTSTQDEWCRLPQTQNVKPNTVYTCIFKYKSTIDKCSIRVEGKEYGEGSILKHKEYTNLTPNTIYSDIYTFTTRNKEDYMNICIRNTYGGIVTVYKPIFLEGDWTNKEIPPYFEGLQSSFEEHKEEDKYKIEILSKTSKNLYDLKTVNQDWLGGTMDVIINPNDLNYHSCEPFDISHLRGKTIYAGMFREGILRNNGINFVVIFDENKTRIGERFNITSNGYLVPSNAKYMRLMQYCGGNSKFWIDKDKYVIKLEPFTNGEKLVEHKSNKIKLLLNSPLLKGDKLEVKNGKLYHYHKMGKDILNGNESWGKGVTSEDYLDVRLNNMSTLKPSSHTEIGGFCDVLPYRSNKNGSWIGTDEGVTRYPATNGIILSILKTRLSTQDVQGFKTWLQSNPIILVYELAEPYYEEVTNEYGEPILLEGYENGTLYIDSAIVPTATVRYTPKMESFKTLKEVENNNIMLTNDVNDNIIPYMMDVDLMIMEKEMALMSHKNIRKMEVLDMTSMQKRTQDMLERLIKGKTLTEQECKTRVTTYLHAGKITDEQAEELMLLIDEVYA